MSLNVRYQDLCLRVEVLSKPDGGSDTIAKLCNDLVPAVEDLAKFGWIE